MKKRSECDCACHKGLIIHFSPCCEPDEVMADEKVYIKYKGTETVLKNIDELDSFVKDMFFGEWLDDID